jgi:hypothetical protein
MAEYERQLTVMVWPMLPVPFAHETITGCSDACWLFQQIFNLWMIVRLPEITNLINEFITNDSETDTNK